jgi:hypothetical protein
MKKLLKGVSDIFAGTFLAGAGSFEDREVHYVFETGCIFFMITE